MAKVGRPRKIDSPETLLSLFREYKTWVKDNPRYKYTLNQRSGEMVAEPLEVPLSMEGFEVYCYNKHDKKGAIALVIVAISQRIE